MAKSITIRSVVEQFMGDATANAAYIKQRAYKQHGLNTTTASVSSMLCRLRQEHGEVAVPRRSTR